MNIIIKTTITSDAGTLLHESSQTVRTDIPAGELPIWALPRVASTPIAKAPAKRKPGRPRKNPLPDASVPAIKRKPGRPRKVVEQKVD